jgi:DNA-directed RNA polymerase subunit M/transcription elongation factor TFIIS
MPTTTPWITELVTLQPKGRPGPPPLLVRPAMRHLVIRDLQQRGSSFDTAMVLERVAFDAAANQLRVYMTLITDLTRITPPLSASAFANHCCRGDTAQDHLGKVNGDRDALVRELSAMQFSSSVPEASAAHRRCPGCGGGDLLTQARQTRSADEGLTVFYVCQAKGCGKMFR